MDRLTGDQWGISEWLQAAKEQRPDSRPFSMGLPEEVSELLEQMKSLCAQHDIPMFAVFSLPAGLRCEHQLLDKPEHCSHPFMMARATASVNPDYLQALVLNPEMLMFTPRKPGM